ncbi:MAG: M48 family metallopeptidase [Alphaproteobacteria bacterium]
MQDLSVSGRYFAPRTSRFELVTFHLDGAGFRVLARDESVLESGPLDTIHLTADVAGLPCKAELRSGGLFETDDHAAFRKVFGPEGADLITSRWQGNISCKRWAILFLLSLAVPPTAWFGYPYLADSVARSLPQSVDRALGRSVMEQLDGTVFRPTSLSTVRRQEISDIFDEMVVASETPPDSVRLAFRASVPFGANALAFPDGTIVLMDELVRLSEHNDEIAAVLAHEIAHVSERHALRRIARAAGISVLVTVVIGDTSSILEEVAAVGAGLWELSYSREFELEADRVAADVMDRTGRDPERLIDLLQRINAECGEACDETSLFSTHPGMRDRLEALDGSR